MFDSALRSTGDLAGVFEYDGETGYFYLYEERGDKGRQVMAAIRVLTGRADFDEGDVAIRWDAGENSVGLFIRCQLWAAFDAKTGAKYGGNYRTGAQAEIPPQIVSAFGTVGNQ
jgi:hypothetical protein